MLNPLDNLSASASIDIEFDLILTLPCLILLLVLVISRRHGKSAGYLLSVCLFWVYLMKLAGATLTPFPMEFNHTGDYFTGFHFVPALIEGDPAFRLESEQVWGNFLTGVPFGFAFPFVLSRRFWTLRHRMACGLGLAIAPEFIQLLQNMFMYGYGGRSVDIDDVWLCFTGSLAGYAFLQIIARLYRLIAPAWLARLPIWNHFHDVLISLASSAKSKASSASPTPDTAASTT